MALRAAVMSGLLLFAVCIPACAEVARLDRFEKRTAVESAATGSDFFALKVSFLGMRPHTGQMLEYRVVDANNFVQSRGVVAKVPPSSDVTMTVPRAIPRVNGPYRLDFFADVNGSGGFDGIGSVVANDHAWRIEPLLDKAASEGLLADDVVEITFQHSTLFTNIDQYPSGTTNPSLDTGLGARLHLMGLDPWIGRTLRIRVVERTSGHVVGSYQRTGIEVGVEDAVVPGCVDTDTEYDISVYIDANGNERYDDPGDASGDRGWRVPWVSSVTGIEAALDLGSASLGDGHADVGGP